MKFNVCLVSPPNYIHIQAFWEMAEAIHFSLIELGHESTLQLRKMEKDATNIVFGCHLLEEELISKMPKSTIFINTEQIYADDGPWNKRIFEWAKHFEIWDYSPRNITRLSELKAPNVKLLRLGYQRELERIQKVLQPDIDVLFYGSLNPRRQKILDDLKNKGLRVKSVFGVYGQERDQLISQSKLILNHHFYKSEIFEVVRVSYLLTNSIAVVGEVNESTSVDQSYKKAICATPYESLVESCIELCSNPHRREELAEQGFKIISEFPQSKFTKELLS